MRHPFSMIPAGKRGQLFFPLLGLNLILLLVMNWIAAPLETEAAPLGIISYELAGNAAKAAHIIASWHGQALIHAAFSLGLDYLFLVLYSTTISLGCVWSAEVLNSRGWRLSALGIPLAWAQWLAALLDALENAGLILILFGKSAQIWAPIARWCAILKFAIIFAGLTYAFLGLVVYLGGKSRR